MATCPCTELANYTHALRLVGNRSNLTVTQVYGNGVELGTIPYVGDHLTEAHVRDGCQVSLFEHFDFNGPEYILRGSAPYAVYQSGKDGAPKFSMASSMKVTCTGQTPPAPATCPCPPSNSSIGGEDTVRLVSENPGPNHTPHHKVRWTRAYGEGEHSTLPGELNDHLTEVHVTHGCRATLYKDANFAGASQVLMGAPPFRVYRHGEDGFDIRSTSSMKVDCGCGGVSA